MYCKHCGEEIESHLSDDPAARCPVCEQLLTDLPVDFQPLAKTDEHDLAAVERVMETLHRRSPELFVLPQTTIPLPSRRSNEETRAASVSSSPTLNQPSALQALLMQPLPTMPAEATGSSLNWLFMGIGILCFACGGVLLILATAISRNDLWSIGFPLILGGQGGIIFGLVGLMELHQQRATKLHESLRAQREHLEMLQQIAVLNNSNPANSAELPIHPLRTQWEMLRQMRSAKAA